MKYKKIIKDLVYEALERDFYEALVMLDSNREKNLTEILDQIRAVCKITIVAVIGPAKPLSLYKEQAKLRIKFLRIKESLSEDLKEISQQARKIDGVYSFRVLTVNKVEFREN